MATQYNTIMERLMLTDAERARILKTVTAAGQEPKQAKVIRFPHAKQLAAIAACAAILILTVIAVPQITDLFRSETEVAGTSSITEFASAKELEEAIGFHVEEVTALPFVPEETLYCNYFGDFAQIVYQHGDASVTFRKAAGSEDISGDYNAYEAEKTVQVNDVPVILKGNNGTFALAVWQKDGYTYSLHSDPAVSEAELVKTLLSLT